MKIDMKTGNRKETAIKIISINLILLLLLVGLVYIGSAEKGFSV
jgi:hypothetical protein